MYKDTNLKKDCLCSTLTASGLFPFQVSRAAVDRPRADNTGSSICIIVSVHVAVPPHQNGGLAGETADAAPPDAPPDEHKGLPQRPLNGLHWRHIPLSFRPAANAALRAHGMALDRLPATLAFIELPQCNVCSHTPPIGHFIGYTHDGA